MNVCQRVYEEQSGQALVRPWDLFYFSSHTLPKNPEWLQSTSGSIAEIEQNVEKINSKGVFC